MLGNILLTTVLDFSLQNGCGDSSSVKLNKSKNTLDYLNFIIPVIPVWTTTDNSFEFAQTNDVKIKIAGKVLGGRRLKQ